ncbi:hypothetical protein [Pandoraea terrigena]|uniref:Uncharacterized protein n=3 Tax=Pandoraea TaxID=93217 RepID=A0A5E4XH18_9BURK|nr:hypothetical protein [Pandoraea terrigena]VVE17850.1 hypothetical protein PCE31107_02990 [Pandoraea cepalis]VVE35674.1 hypothetical protein PTE31013_03911 [Pandoraea terrigena]
MTSNIQTKAPEPQAATWFVGVLQERNGEYMYGHKVLLQVCGSPEDKLRDIAQSFYDEEGEPSDNGFYHNGRELFLSPASVTPIEENEAKVLQRFLVVCSDDAAIEWMSVESAEATNPEKAWHDVCNVQGWNAESQIIHLEGFLRDRNLFTEFAAYAKRSADEEDEAGASDVNAAQILLTPSVAAAVYTDAKSITVKFDAAAWFAVATDQAIIDLHGIGWTGDYAADDVARHFEDSNPDIEGLFAFCRATNGTREQQGFECLVDEREAMGWLRQHRRGLWARLLCEDNNVKLVEAQKPEVHGMWNWLGDEGNGCERSFATVDEAALNAVDVLKLEVAVHAGQPTPSE